MCHSLVSFLSWTTAENTVIFYHKVIKSNIYCIKSICNLESFSNIQFRNPVKSCKNIICFTKFQYRDGEFCKTVNAKIHHIFENIIAENFSSISSYLRKRTYQYLSFWLIWWKSKWTYAIMFWEYDTLTYAPQQMHLIFV